MDKEYDIWREGFKATGQSGGARLLGHSTGKDLKDACKNLAKKDNRFAEYFNEEKMTYWGCDIFDNGLDASKLFG